MRRSWKWQCLLSVTGLLIEGQGRLSSNSRLVVAMMGMYTVSLAE